MPSGGPADSRVTWDPAGSWAPIACLTHIALYKQITNFVKPFIVPCIENKFCQLKCNYECSFIWNKKWIIHTLNIPHSGLSVSSHLEWLEVVSTPKGRKALYVVGFLVIMLENKIFERDLHNFKTEATSEVETGAHRLDYIFWIIIFRVKKQIWEIIIQQKSYTLPWIPPQLCNLHLNDQKLTNPSDKFWILLQDSLSFLYF